MLEKLQISVDLSRAASIGVETAVAWGSENLCPPGIRPDTGLVAVQRHIAIQKEDRRMNPIAKENSSANKSFNNRIKAHAEEENSSPEIAFSQFEYLSRQEMLVVWMKQMKRTPPKGISRSLMLRAIAYEFQRKDTGGLTRHEQLALCRAAEPKLRAPPINESTDRQETPDTEKSAKDVTYANKAKRKRPKMRRALKPGTRLVRNWQGKAHVIEVQAAGFDWNGNVYKSLTVVAEKITGTHQSGPRFFRT